MVQLHRKEMEERHTVEGRLEERRLDEACQWQENQLLMQQHMDLERERLTKDRRVASSREKASRATNRQFVTMI
jgi:hypothetical protein